MINVRDHSKFSVSLSPTFARAFTILNMKLVLASCLLLSLVGVSQQFIPGLGHLKLGLLGGAKLGLLKSQLKSQSGDSSSSSKKEQESCRSVPQQQCKNVEETVYESVTSQKCTKKPVQDCRQQQETTYEEVSRQECHDVTEQSCKDVQDRKCRTVSKPVQVNRILIFTKISCTFNSLCWLILPVDVRKSATLYGLSLVSAVIILK